MFTITVVGAAGVLIQQAMQNQNSNELQPQQHAEQEGVEQTLRRQDAVLVFGAGGKVGRKIVTEVSSCCLLLACCTCEGCSAAECELLSFPPACSC